MHRTRARAGSITGLLAAVAVLTAGLAPQPLKAQALATVEGHTEPLGPLTHFATCVAAQSTSGAFVDATTADLGSGAYPLSVPAGAYSVLFTDCAGHGFTPEWHEDAATHAGSTPVVAQDGAVARYDVVL